MPDLRRQLQYQHTQLNAMLGRLDTTRQKLKELEPLMPTVDTSDLITDALSTTLIATANISLSISKIGRLLKMPSIKKGE